MRSFYIALSPVWVAGFILCACSQDTGEGQTTSSGNKILSDCHDVFVVHSSECNTCLQEHCCSELSACQTLSPKCVYCASQDPGAAVCMEDPQRPLSVALLHCAAHECPVPCNAVPDYYDAGTSGSGGSGG